MGGYRTKIHMKINPYSNWVATLQKPSHNFNKLKYIDLDAISGKNRYKKIRTCWFRCIWCLLLSQTQLLMQTKSSDMMKSRRVKAMNPNPFKKISMENK